jgi:hypothetical protein
VGVVARLREGVLGLSSLSGGLPGPERDLYASTAAITDSLTGLTYKQLLPKFISVKHEFHAIQILNMIYQNKKHNKKIQLKKNENKK